MKNFKFGPAPGTDRSIDLPGEDLGGIFRVKILKGGGV